MSGGTYTGKGAGEDRTMQIDDQTLMALADGELDPARAEELRRAIAADPALQSRLHQFEETRRLLGGMREAGPAEDPLAALIRAAATTPTPAPSVLIASRDAMAVSNPRPGARPLTAPAHGQPANRNSPPWLALAASLAIMAVGLGWWNWAGGPVSQGISGAELAALNGLPSGQVQALESGGELAMIASFRASDGTFCREYETVRQAELRIVLACRAGDAWVERFAGVAAAAGQDYRPASGEGSIDAAIAAIGAAGPMSPEEEMAALTE